MVVHSKDMQAAACVFGAVYFSREIAHYAAECSREVLEKQLSKDKTKVGLSLLLDLLRAHAVFTALNTPLLALLLCMLT